MRINVILDNNIIRENELNGSCAFLGYSNLFNYLTYWSGKYECWKLAFTN